MKIRAKQSFGHSESKQTFQAGKEYDVKPEHGQHFVDTGLADEVAPLVKDVVVVPVSVKEPKAKKD